MKKNRIDETLSRYLHAPEGVSRDLSESSRARILDAVEQAAGEPETSRRSFVGPQKPSWRFRLALTAIGVVIAVLGAPAILRDYNAMAEAVHGSLYRVSSADSRIIQAGEKIQRGALIRSNGGGVFKLSDGSVVEMRDESELLLERAGVGIEIHLKKGGILLSAAKQGKGQISVQTKDMIMSDLGAVSLVNAEEGGSRVAVVQGEVRVQQGARMQKLLPGEQVVSSAAMSVVAPVSLALLRQTAALVGQPPDKFEVVSVRPTPAGTQVSSSGGGDDERRYRNPCFLPRWVQLNPGRLAITEATLHGLIAVAFGVSCTLPDAVSGEPEWAKSDRYDIQGTIPAGSPAYTRTDLLEGHAPKLQRMLQDLLATRFKLKLRREVKEMPAYNLVVVKQGKWECRLPEFCHGLRLSEDQAPDGSPAIKPEENFLPVNTKYNLHTSISAWTEAAAIETGRPVIDKTGLKGFYDIRLEYPGIPASLPLGELLEGRKSWFPVVIQDQLGFKLEPTTALVEVLIIEGVEKPSEN
jgi:uncharacterized protein (TIGR03435 family)